MPSSKFARRPTARKVPAICKKPPLIPFPALPLTSPDRLVATALWYDLDPLAYTKIEQTITLTQQGGPHAYAGAGPKTPDYLTCTAERIGPGPNWSFTLRIYNAFHNGWPYTWSPVHVDPDQPFHSGLLWDTVIPGQDYRLLRVSAR